MAGNPTPPQSSSPTNDHSRLSTTSTDASGAPAELSAVVDELLNSLSNKFAGVSSEIFAKMDEMSRRLDNLEAQLQANSEQGRDGKSSPTKM
ncbi:putative heat shock factor-binding protein 1 [Halenospora varia]|nr:putative heat shock factor-binding protein 1 [Halenospora varia]